MFKKAKLIFNIVSLVLIAVVLTTLGYSWFTVPRNSIDTEVTGKLVQEYFHCGSGKQDDPFVITRPVHYYHLVEFYQRTTNLPVVYDEQEQEVLFGSELLYFQIGCPEEQLYDSSLRPVIDDNTEFYVFDYSNWGQVNKNTNPDGDKSQVLNMAYYSDKNSLMPIGSSEVPFYGVIEGNCITIQNLSVVSSEDVVLRANGTSTTVTRQSSDLGVFGFVYGGSAINNMYIDSMTIALTGAETDATINTSVTDCEHTASHEDDVYVGLIAGHIQMGAQFNNVYVNNSSILGGAAATCNFGYFGLVDNNDDTTVQTLGEEVAKLRGEGEDNGFGGSMDMLSLHTRIKDMKNTVGNTSYYVTSEDIGIDEATGDQWIINQTTSTVTANPNADSGDIYYYYDSPTTGGRLNVMPSSGDRYMCLYGESVKYTKTVYTYTYKNEYVDGFILGLGTNYLGIVDGAISAVNSAQSAQVWALDNSNHLYTYYAPSTSDTSCIYYLNRNGETGLSLSQTASTTWTVDGDNIYTTANNKTYYIIYDPVWVGTNGGWGVTTVTSTVKISDGTNYLNTNGTAITTSTDANLATRWAFDENTGYIYTYVNGTIHYLYGTNGLTLSSTNQTEWYYDEQSGQFTYEYDDSLFYLVFENNTWIVSTSLESYTICDSDGHYLNVNGTNISVGTSANASKWFYNGEDGNLCINVNNVIYYLNKGLILTQSNPAMDWYYSDGTLSYVEDGVSFYLVFSDNAWHTLQDQSVYVISNGDGTYLVLSSTGMSYSTNSSNATYAYYEGRNGVISFDYSGTTYYLNRNGAISQTSDNTSWVFNNNTLSYVYNNETYYLIFANGNWYVTKDLITYSFRDTNNHYLNATTTGISVGTNTNYTHWIYNANNNGTLSTIINSTTYYLNANLNVSTTSDGTNWILDANNRLYYVSGNTNQYLIYFGDTWIVSPTYTAVRITDGTRYLNATTGGVTSGTAANSATTWLRTSDNKFFIVSNGTFYYLTGSTTDLNVSTTPMIFTYENNVLSYTVNNTLCKIRYYNNKWVPIDTSISYYIIQDSRGHYMTASGNTLGKTTTEADATLFKFNGTNGNISYDNNGTEYFLYAQSTTDWKKLSLDRTNKSTFTYDATNGLRTSNKYVFYNNDGWIVNANKDFYIISSGTNYMNVNNTPSNYRSTTSGTVLEDATLWSFSSTSSGTITTGYNGSTGSLRYYNGNLRFSSTPTTWTISGMGTTATSISYKSGNTTYYMRYNNNAFSVNKATNTLTTTAQTVTTGITQKELTPASITFNNVTVNSTFTKTAINEPNTINIAKKTVVYDITIASNELNTEMSLIQGGLDRLEVTDGKKMQKITKSKATNVPSGNPTYIPLIVNQTNGQYPEGYAASSNNTGYIISGAHLEETEPNNTSQVAYGDIRVSYFPINNNISNSYNRTSKAFTKIYTYNGSNVDITNNDDDYVAFGQAKENFLKTLSGQTNVYGLHFMNAAISTNHIIKADSVGIFGSTYYNYEMPEDSIDFYAVQRGQIAFFAGTYFTNNNAFFSLHQIFRDNSKHITDIKEIQYVYAHSTQGANSPYVYKYTDETYGSTNAGGAFVELDSIPSGYEQVFNTDWIKNPGTINNKYLYYFEIPCNQGEYALGSAQGKTGAYLTYLDIGTNGGAMLESMISTDGTDLTNAFSADFRSYPDTVNTTIIQFSISAPEDSTEENFKVTVDFDNSSETCEDTAYSSGLYTITVTNLTEHDCEMLVLLCDDDQDFTTQFNYAYRIKYINSDNPNGAFICPVDGIDYWQSSNGYLITYEGASEQMNFN